MELLTELQNEKQKILIVAKNDTLLTALLKTELKKYDNEVFVSPVIPSDLDKFNMCFIINAHNLIHNLQSISHKKIILVFINKRNYAQRFHSKLINLGYKTTKIVNLENYSDISQEDLDKILWFSFSRSKEMLFTMQSLKTKKMKEEFSLRLPQWQLKPKMIVILFLFLVFLLHTIFIPFLITSTALHYLSARSLAAGNISKTKSLTQQANTTLTISKNFYSIARPTFLLVGIITIPDNIIQLNEKTNIVVQASTQLLEDSNAYMHLFLEKNKTKEDLIFLELRMNKIKQNVEVLDNNLSIIYQKIPSWGTKMTETKEKIKEVLTFVNSFQKIIPHLDDFLSKNSEKKYLLLFANNMEIRPGGGFIGSFGVLTLKNLSIKEMKVYDVYDADGQLSVHISPPDPIKKYLNQPHWFLRDSAFSPDFSENYLQALFFLEKEMGFKDFDGGIIITTSAIQNIFAAVGNIYLPDFKETVNKDNFYLKAQLYAEKNFFPGSQQKKRFLSSVMNQILINTENISKPTLLRMIKKSLDEKQIAVYLKNEEQQSVIESHYWSGRTIHPICAAKTDNCVVDYLFTVDANLGVNKANFFISKSSALDINIDSQGKITNTLSMKIKNESSNDVFPGGTYKNYLQIIIPKDSIIKSFTKDNTLIEDYEKKENIYKNVSFFLEIKPQSSADIVLKYQPNNTISKGQGVYQLIIQKQIGTANSDIALTMSFPKNIYMVNQNFSPLVKDNTLVYNTTLTSDKIFFIDLIKE